MIVVQEVSERDLFIRLISVTILIYDFKFIFSNEIDCVSFDLTTSCLPTRAFFQRYLYVLEI